MILKSNGKMQKEDYYRLAAKNEKYVLPLYLPLLIMIGVFAREPYILFDILAFPFFSLAIFHSFWLRYEMMKHMKETNTLTAIQKSDWKLVFLLTHTPQEAITIRFTPMKKNRLERKKIDGWKFQ